MIVAPHADAFTLQRGDGLPRTSDLLNAIRNMLSKDVLPGVTDERSQVLLQMTDLVLRHLIGREDLSGAGAFEIAWRADPAGSIDPALVESRLASMRQSAEEGNAVRLSLIACEEAALERMTAAEAAVKALEFDTVTQAQFLVTPERLTAYLQNHVPTMFGAEVTGIKQVVGGLSKETFLLDVEQGSASFGLVLRRDIPNPPIQSSAPDEVDILKPLFNFGLQVPEPIWAERDPAHFGMPFQISRRVAGTAIPGAIDMNNLPRSARRNAELLAIFLGKLHCVPIDLFTPRFRPSWRTCDYVADHLREWQAWWRANQMEPSAIMSVAFDWLLANIPDANDPVIVHGDAGLHNLMTQDGGITAMIDWELVHIGDASEDLLYCRNWVDQVMEFEEFLEIYQSNGGKIYDSSRARFYSLLTSVRNVTCTIAQYRGFRDAAVPLLPSAYSGLKWQRTFLLKAAEDLKLILASKHGPA